mmetsp:Transcript_6175/g.6733  ORF Transcript_6175/g.6733 Transcript_6175/m.6733 type:complete len:85 (-) Transcript_6175:32-286(-)
MIKHWLFLKENPSKKYFDYDWDANGHTDIICAKESRACFPWWGLMVLLLGGVAIGMVVICVCVPKPRKETHDYSNIQEKPWAEQ